jgi:hypothetical protein
MTTSVDYTLTAALEGDNIAQSLVDGFRHAGWQLTTKQDILEALKSPIALTIDTHHSHQVLIFGHFTLTNDANLDLQIKAILHPIEGLKVSYLVEVFEEDGRLVKRIQGPAS